MALQPEWLALTRRLMPRARPFCLSLARDESGTVAVFVGLALAALLGFTALAIDVGLWYHTRRDCQNAADSAAFSAATAIYSGSTDPTSVAKAVAANYGFVNGADGAVVSIDWPPATGGHASDRGAVEVLVQKPAARFFTQVFGVKPSLITGRAVAQVGVVGDGCVVALHTDASVSALETGGANVDLHGCSLYGNSSDSGALTMKGGASLSAASVRLVGSYSVSGGARITATNGIWSGQSPIADPYAAVPIPSYSGCDYNSASLSSGHYGGGDAPTVFCNGLTLNRGVNVVLDPGVYVVDRGVLAINGGATLTGTGVTIVLTSSTGTNYPTVTINGGAVVSLSAPTTGPTQGLAFFQDRRAPGSGSNTFNGGAQLNVTGAIYFPNQLVTFSGGASTSANGCTQLIAGSVYFTGGSTFGKNCANTGVELAGGRATRLIE